MYETGAFKYGPGDVKYKDLDGNGEITYGEQTLEDHGDLKRIGNTLPNFEYGFSVALTYKDFDFSHILPRYWLKRCMGCWAKLVFRDLCQAKGG